MTKAIISNRIYLNIPPEGPKEIMSKLTYKIEIKKGNTKFRSVEIIKNYKIINANVISIPQGRTDLIPEGYTIEDRRTLNPVPFPTPKFDLRPGQVDVFNQVEDTCFINALVGWGKTFTALHLARKLGQKTLVITHTTALRDQWIEEAEALFDMEIGIIGSGKFDIEDKAIVIGNVQTVNKHLQALSKEFGTIILDEAHHCPATTFSEIIDSSHARYRIGLSGTMIRTDGKHIVFKDYFGDKIFKPPQSHTLNPRVKIVKTGIMLDPGAAWVDKMNKLLYDPDYQELVATIAKLQINKGHKVLIAADRVEFLTNIKELLGDDCVLITGETAFEERKGLIAQVETGAKSCIAGSRQIFSEGISVNILSCVILAVPTANPIMLEQLIGRIMRLHPGKLPPLVVDLQFNGAEKKQNSARLGFYMSKGWDIETV